MGDNVPTVMLLLRKDDAIDQGKLNDALRRLFPRECGVEELPHAGLSPSRDTLLLPIAGLTVALLMRLEPLPDGWQQIAANSIHWSDAVQVSSQHRAHLIISIMNEHADLLLCSRVVTAVANAYIAISSENVLGGLYGVQVLNSAEAWRNEGAKAFVAVAELPFSLWVSRHLFRDQERGDVGLVTQGLARFVGRELEMTAGPSDLKTLLEYSYGLVAYLVEHGPILKNGDTFGTSKSEKISLSLSNSRQFAGLPVVMAKLSRTPRRRWL